MHFVCSFILSLLVVAMQVSSISWLCPIYHLSILVSEGFFGRKSLPPGDYDGCIFTSFCVWLLGIQEWYVIVLLRFWFIFIWYFLLCSNCKSFLYVSTDIQFWNKNKSMEGLSAKSVVVSFISQLIVFLYLLDNDTSWMILASSGVGCCIEFWKIGKAMIIEVCSVIFLVSWSISITIQIIMRLILCLIEMSWPKIW